MKLGILTLALASVAFAQNWTSLFDGKTLKGWTPEGGAEWKVRDGAIVVESGANGWLRSNDSYGDFILSLEFKTAADGNSGVFLRSAKDGQPHVTGYELQIFDNQPAGFHTGALVNHIKPQKPSKIRPNEWMTYVIEARGPKWIVKLDGVTVLTGEDSKSLRGHIGLQYNTGKPIQFRNIRIQRLN